MDFEIIDDIYDIEIIAIGSKIRILVFLQQEFERALEKIRGVANVRLSNGEVRLAEIHWFEAHGIGKKFLRIKRYLD